MSRSIFLGAAAFAATVAVPAAPAVAQADAAIAAYDSDRFTG